jgi:ribosome biogenesis GTPase
MVLLPKGGILIDNPGIREVGLADTAAGLETTFDLIQTLSRECKYADCSHVREDGCAVIEAVEKGELDRSAYENYLKMEREKAHFQSTIAEKRKKDKDFGKMVKAYKKNKKQNKG